MYQERNGLRHYRHCIDGRWVAGGGAIEVENPANAESVAMVPDGITAEAASALEAAERAQLSWAALPPIRRAEHLERLAGLVERDAEALARLVTLEQGKPLAEAKGEVAGGDAVHAHHAGHGDGGLGGEDGKYGIEGYLRKKAIYVNWA